VTRGSAFVDSLVGQKIAGRYVVDRLLGVGGMGVVAGGRYPELGQKVAIKFLKPEYADEKVVNDRFMREARVAAKVKSAHFVRVYDVGRHDSGVPYYVMEMLHGKDLSDELKSRGPLPVEDAVDYILQACVGVAELHALGVVHRDLKPSNLFVTDRTIKVLDFGISKEQVTETRGALTATDNVLGTPQYMSPEQIKHSKDVDGRADIWALGVILYELLTTKLPFVAEGSGVGELFARILYFEPTKPTEHRPDLPPALEEVLMKCLTRDAAARYADVAAFAEALRPFASKKSQARIETVQEVLATPHPAAGDSEPPPPVSPVALAPTTPANVSQKATVQVGKRTPASDPVVSAHADAESIHASSVELGLPKKRTGTVTYAVIAAGALVVGTVAFVMSRPADHGAPATAEPAPPVSIAPAASTAPSPPPLDSSPFVVPPPPSASAAVKAAPAVKVTPKPPPPTKPTASPNSDPILDRK